jgi:hypothetical protein
LRRDRRKQQRISTGEDAAMGKAPRGAKRKKALAVKDLTVKDAKTVKGGTTDLMKACATGAHIKEVIVRQA